MTLSASQVRWVSGGMVCDLLMSSRGRLVPPLKIDDQSSRVLSLSADMGGSGEAPTASGTPSVCQYCAI